MKKTIYRYLKVLNKNGFFQSIEVDRKVGAISFELIYKDDFYNDKAKTIKERRFHINEFEIECILNKINKNRLNKRFKNWRCFYEDDYQLFIDLNKNEKRMQGL